MEISPNRFHLKFWLNTLLIVALMLLARPAQAASTDLYVATTGSDSGTCSTQPTACLTINYAIGQAASGDTIHIDAGTYGTVDVEAVKDLTFSGAGRDLTILDGGGADRVFTINSLVNTTILDLTITHGYMGICGGGIDQNTGTLTLTRVKVTANTAEFGAGICSTGSLTITDSEISANTANATSHGYGGALFLNANGATDTLTNVTVSGNSATAGAGGLNIQNYNSPTGSTTLTNVTISGNTSPGNTAMNIYNHAHVILINSTIANNQSTSPGFTGGISIMNATMTIKNSILAGNSPFNCKFGSGATWASQGNNIDSGTTCQFTHSEWHDQQNTDPMLGPLANHGGPNQTMALLRGSPAIDGVTYNAPNGCPAADERGITRPFGPFCDIGAYEANFLYVFLPLAVR